MSNSGHLIRFGSYLSTETQSMYSTAPADWLVFCGLQWKLGSFVTFLFLIIKTKRFEPNRLFVQIFIISNACIYSIPSQWVNCETRLNFKAKYSLFEFGVFPTLDWGCSRGVMVKALDCGIVVQREFVLQSRYYVHFWANTLGKGMNPLIFPAMGLIVPLLFF